MKKAAETNRSIRPIKWSSIKNLLDDDFWKSTQ